MTFLSNISKFFQAEVTQTPATKTVTIGRNLGGRYNILDNDGNVVRGTASYTRKRDAIRGATRQGFTVA